MAYNVYYHVIGTFQPTTKTYLLRKGLYVMSNLIIPQTGLNGQHTPQNDNLISTEKISSYCASLQNEVNHLEEELQKKRIILGLYQSWLDQRTKAGEK